MSRWEKWRLRLHMSAPRLKLTCAGLHLGCLGRFGPPPAGAFWWQTELVVEAWGEQGLKLRGASGQVGGHPAW